MVSLVNDGLLVVAVGLVASCEFCQTVHILHTVGISLDDDLVGGGALYHAGILCNDADARVNSRLSLDTSSHHRSLGGKQRHSLTLHVGTH